MVRKSATRGSISRSRVHAHRGSIRLGLVLAVLVGINLYVFLWRGGTSIPEVRQAAMAADGPAAASDAELAPQAAGPLAVLPEAAAGAEPVAAERDPGRWIEGKVESGDSLGQILKRHGFDPQQTDEVVRALRPHMDFRAIRVGQRYRIRVDGDGALDRFEFHLSKVKKVKAVRRPSGELSAEEHEADTEVRLHEVGGSIESSLYGAIKEAGEDTRLVAFMVDVFAFDLNFYIDQHQGDTFRMLVEKEYLRGEFLRYRKVRAAEYSGKAGTFRAFYWESDDGKIKGYFDDKGRSIERTFLKTPLKYARISSKFNRNRMHPVLHTRRAHLGVDYAAPTGTPIWAAASGRIVSRGRAGGAGNRVIIDHGNGYHTIYMHLSKFAKGQKVGSRVRQKNVIGYVGMTGLATGPHLHFSVKKNGRYIDPLKMKMARSAGIPTAYRGAFEREVGQLVAQLGDVRVLELPAWMAGSSVVQTGEN